MRPLYNTLPTLLAVLGLLTLGSCKQPESMGLYDPNEPQAPTPTITGITPAGRAFAGMDTVIIQGTNFSSVIANNVVYFNASPAMLLSASSTQLMLKAPLVTMDSIGVRIAVMGAVSFSNTFQYKLSAGAATFGVLVAGDASSSLATDAAGNLFADYNIGGVESGILKFTPDGVRSNFAPASPGVGLLWWGLKMGPGGYLYSVRNVRAIYRFPTGGGSSAAVWASCGNGTYVSDLDFDKDGNIWAGGNNANVFRVDVNKVVATYPFAGTVHSVRVFNDYVYFAALKDSAEKIWRAPITSGVMGTPEVYFDFSAIYPGKIPLAITFSSDGVLYIGTDAQDGLVVVSAAKAVSAPYTAYKSLFGTGIGFLAWGKTDDLYASTSNGVLLKFTIRGKTSATYFGATL